MPQRVSFLSIGAGLTVLLGIAIYLKLGTFEGGPTRVPDEAVPIWANPNMSWANKITEYLFPLLMPLGSMAKCSLKAPYDFECMAKARKAGASRSEAPWASATESTHEEIVVQVQRKTGATGQTPPLEVILLQPRNMTVSPSDAPLILWMHGGGFTVGQARDFYMLSYVGRFKETPVAQDAIWASVEYRLAPEHPYPAAPEDCILALQYLLTEYSIDSESPERRLGGGGVHIAGVSAGGTLAATTALRALKAGLHVDSVFVEVPMFLTPTVAEGDDVFSPVLDASSHRVNAYTRITPIQWLDWCVYAVTGKGPEFASSITDVDFTGGVMSVPEWKASAGNQQLPPMVLPTAKYDGLHDGGLKFARVYEEAGGNVYHVDASSSHAFALLFDRQSVQEVIKKWSSLIQSAAGRT